MTLAIIGAAVRVPGSDTVDGFWHALRAGHVGLGPIPDDEAAASGVPAADLADPRYVPVGSRIDDAASIDLDFFRLSRGEAELIDPQHRLVLKLAAEALQVSGVDPAASVVGTFGSVSMPTYLLNRVAPRQRLGGAAIPYPALLGNDPAFAAARVARKLGLTGPALAVQSACSSSLMAVHQAAAALAAGTVDAAIVVAASLATPGRSGYITSSGDVLSPSGRCAPFDAAADGVVPGQGGAAVVLTRLSDAVARGADILAVVAGTAANNDGAAAGSFTHPHPGSQAAVLSAALADAGIGADRVRYVETHGTATALGDPIEIRGLHQAHGPGPECLLGGIKANYGHLDAAAGVAGLLKAALVLRHGVVPPQPGFGKPNPALELDRTRFRVADAETPLPDGAAASVSSFGMGGGNVSAVLVPAPPRPGPGPSSAAGPPAAATVVLRAPSAPALSAYRRRLARALTEAAPGRREVTVADVARTLAERPERGDHTVAIRAADIAGLVRELGADAARPDTADAVSPAGADAPPLGGRFVSLPPTPFVETDVDLPPIVEFAPAPAPEPAVRHDPAAVRETVGEEFLRALGADALDDALLAADFMDAGGESVMLVDLVGELEGRYESTVDFGALDTAGSIGELIDLLVAQITGAPAPEPVTLVRYGDWRRPGPRWLLHPPAGGTALVYRQLSQELGDAPIGVFTSPAGERSLPEIAADAIAAIPPDVRGPLLLGGYSFGGNVAVEMALQLERAGRPVAHVALIDALAPESYGAAPQALDDAAYGRAAALVLGRVGAGDAVRTPDFAARWRHHHRALVEHRPAGRIAAPVTLLRATDPEPTGVFAALGVRPAHDWSRYAAGRVDVIDVPGDHYSILTDARHRAELLRSWRRAFPGGASARRPGPAQARLAAAQFARPDDPGANIGAVMEFPGLDPQRLAAAVAAVAAATEAVNDTVVRADGALVRSPHPAPRPRVPVVPYPTVDAVIAAAEDVLDRAFPPEVWPLYHLEVAVCGSRTFALFVTSHLVTDVFGWYLTVLDIAAAYREGEGWTPPASVAPDAVALPAVDADAAVAHFRGVLPAHPPAPPWARRTGNAPLPGTGSRTTVDGARAIAAARSLGVRPFSFLLAAHAVTAGCLGAGPAVPVSVPLSNRRSGPDAATCRGVLVNTLPVCVDVAAPGTSFADVAREVDRQLGALIAIESFDLLKHGDRVPGAAAAAGAPTSFTMYPRPLTPRIGGTAGVTHPLRRRHVQFPLSVMVERAGDELTVLVEQCEALRGVDVGALYASVLRSAADRPDRPLTEIEWTHPAVPGPPAADRPPRLDAAPDTLVARFRRAVDRAPDAPAVSSSAGTVGYAELDRRARRVAAGIAEWTGRPLVGVAMRPSADLIATILGALSAGRAYVPIDADAPPERVAAMAEDLGGLDVITDGASPWPDVAGVRARGISELLAGSESAPESAPAGPETGADPRSTAYVIFTSGSTGRPKAVPIEHGAVTALLDATAEARGPAGRWPLFHSPAFDFSVWEIFAPLSGGGTVLIPPPALRRDPAGYLAWLRDQRADVLCLTPSAFAMLDAAATDDDWRALAPRVVFLGGERLEPGAVRRLTRLSGATRAVNLYGPTEATVLTTMTEIEPEAAGPESPIGSPLPHTGAAIVDGAGRPVPPGVPGELLVYGPHVTAGYLGHAAADRSRFVAVRRNGRDHRGYRTGDRAYQRPDGVLVYLGRSDDQVQVRGHRVEPGEVEAALRADPAVGDAAVVAVGSGLDRRLVGFVTPRAGDLDPGDLDPAALASRLRDRVPGYMVPGAILPVAELPAGQSGKVDRHALERLAAGSAADGATVDAADLHRAVDDFWARTLGTRLARDASFFEAGGTSIHVVQLVEHLRADFGLTDLSATDVFAHPSSERLVAYLSPT